jgi:hypothetical protein
MQMSIYRNPTSHLIEFDIGTRPGSPPDHYKVEPGDVTEGPANYAKAFARQGLVECESKPADESAPAPSPSSDERGPSPTIEQWVDAGYPAAKYPPDGYDEVPSPGLTRYRQTGSLAEPEPEPELPSEPEPEVEVRSKPEPQPEPEVKKPSKSKSKAKGKGKDTE